jgi:hypothetical protein
MDWTSNSLANFWTEEDLKRQGLELDEGMRCVFYDLDGEDGQNGFLHAAGLVFWDEKSNRFRAETGPEPLRFTPGDDASVLDALYP